MHTKNNERSRRLLRGIALMLALAVMFVTMSGMAMANSADTNSESETSEAVYKIVDVEIPGTPAETEEPTPPETPEPFPSEPTPAPAETEEPTPPETPETPLSKAEYELDAYIPSGWHNTPVMLTVRIADKNDAGWMKVEVALSDRTDAERFDVTEELNEYGYLEYTMQDNGIVFFFITDLTGTEHKLSLDVYCMDYEAPEIRAGVNGTLLRVEASDNLSGVAAIFVNDELYTTLNNGQLNIRIDHLTRDAYLYIDALDNAGNRADDVVLANPLYEEPTPEPTPTPDTHNFHCPADCDCRNNATAAPSNGSSGSSSGESTAKPSGSQTSSTSEPVDTLESAITPEPVTIEEGTGFTVNDIAVTRDLLYDKYTNKQFITVETRNGHTFYLIIDYDKPLDEDGDQYETYFLNLVDESDLLALIGDEQAVPVCSCKDKCEAGVVNTTCEVCKTNMTECAGKVVEPINEPEVTQEPEPEPEKKSSGNSLLLIALLVVLAGGGAVYWFKFRKPKSQTKGSADLDDYDYGEDENDEEYDNEGIEETEGADE